MPVIAASQSCGDAAEICARKAKEARDLKNGTRFIGGTASGLAIGTGLVLTVATGGIGGVAAGAVVGAVGVAGAVTTHCIASDFARTEASFRSIQQDFDGMEGLTFDLQERVTKVQTNMQSISMQVDKVTDCMKNMQAMTVPLSKKLWNTYMRLVKTPMVLYHGAKES